MIIEKYNWKSKKIPFERTYRKMSNLDDRYENGAHDLLKFIKLDMEEPQTTHQKILEQIYVKRRWN